MEKRIFMNILLKHLPRNIYTIERNTSNKCAERMYSFDDVQVMGYGCPKY